MRQTILHGSLILSSLSGAAQDLLVNRGFEEENTCTEYQVNCAPEAWISNTGGFNNYFKDANRAYEGSHCMAIEAGHAAKPFQRTFIRSQLLCGLKKGNKYRLEFFIKSPHAILDSIGVYFGPIDPLLERKPIHLLAPSFFLKDDSSNKFLKDSSWQKVMLVYTAKGDEAFISVANFSRNDITGKTGIPMENHFFVFLDEFSLVPLNPDEQLCDNWRQVKEDIYDQNERHEFLQRSLKYHSSQPHPVLLAPTRVTVTDTLLLPDVLFSTGLATLQHDSYRLLDSIVSRMTGKSIDSIVVEGHTDNKGTLLLNELLSIDRAKNVGDYFYQHIQAKPLLVITRGWGPVKPIADNSLPAGRQKNRRVEVFLYIRE